MSIVENKHEECKYTFQMHTDERYLSSNAVWRGYRTHDGNPPLFDSVEEAQAAIKDHCFLTSSLQGSQSFVADHQVVIA